MTICSDVRGKTICISGPIAVGKSTLMERLRSETRAMGLSCHFMPELLCPSLNEKLPINAELFDTFVISHRLQMCLDAPHIAKNYDFVMMERCHIDHLAFLWAFDKIGGLSQEHRYWVRKIIKELEPPLPDRFIYLHISPEQAFIRMCERDEARDANFSLIFMKALIESYEKIFEDRSLKQRLIKLNWKDFGNDISTSQIISSIS